MAKFTAVEREMLERITDDRLQSGLEKIREAVEDIWADDAPRIIKDYTDHGIKHSERLVEWANNLLNLNEGRELTTLETYLLLVGIYLHDIGMQCDVVKFPKIKETAEILGAEFEVEFTAQTSNEYALEEQKAIRKNHQFLSAAWIDYAYRTGETVLGHVVKNIPEEIVDDLMDVCKYHSKLAITECPHTFKFNPNERKQLVASLLRLSDELDIEAHRVSFETVKNFSISPHNSIYWWLHNRTKVIFSPRNAILITIRLHPEDIGNYGSFIYEKFIVEFQTKNQPVLNVLSRDGIQIAINADSKIVEDTRAERLPFEFIQELENIRLKYSPLLELADEVRIWLQAIRYEVSDFQNQNERTVDMVATLEQGTIKQRVLVRCVGGEITSNDVDLMDKILDRKTPQGWLISDKRVSDGARKRAAEDAAFRVFKLSDFLQQMVWGSYFDALKALVEKSQIPTLYVDLKCYKQIMDASGNEIDQENYSSIDDYIDNWLTERGKMHISVLGEFGTGKTWFCRYYAYRQLGRYIKDPVNERLPILITLRSFAKAMTAQQMINDALLEQYRLPFVGSAFEIFQEMNRRGKLLLILDGFDEMARQVDYQTVIDNFWDLASLVEEGSKVILTSRTEYFRWAKESEKILGGKEFGKRTILLSPPTFEVLYLEQFNDDQISKVITLRLGEKDGPSMAKQILKNRDLAEMARKPVLIELLLAALDEVSANILKNQAKVYLYATNKLLLRNIDTKRTFTKTADKLYFLCELAWEMIKSGELRIHYVSIPERIKTYFDSRIKDQHELDTWDFDLRSQTLLHRNAAGYYEFAHKSLAEYFVAFKFASELGCLNSEFKTAYCEAEGKSCDILIEQKGVTELADTFGLFLINDERMETVWTLFQQMTAKSSSKQLWKVINETRGKTEEYVKYSGGNAATLLSLRNESFKGANLESTVLAGADLSDTDLTETNFQGACLRKASLINSILDYSNFCLADLQDIEIGEMHEVFGLVWNTSGSHLAAFKDDELVIWNVLNNQEEFHLTDASPRTDRTILFVPNEDRLLYAKGKNLMSISFINKKWEIKTECKFEKQIGCIAINNDGNLLALFQNETIIIWNRKTQEEHLVIKTDKDIHCLLFIPDSNILLAAYSGSKRNNVRTRAGFKLWDIEQNRIVYTHVHTGDTWSRGDYATDKHGNILATCAFNETLKIWSLPSLDLLHEIKKSSSRSLDCNPNGNIIAISNTEFIIKTLEADNQIVNKLNLIDVDSGKITSLNLFSGYVFNSGTHSFSLDGNYFANVGEKGCIHIWHTDSSGSFFPQYLKTLGKKIRCFNTFIDGTRGLEQETTIVRNGKEISITLKELLVDGGAVLDEEQR
jgi:WD40 repeat protein